MFLIDKFLSKEIISRLCTYLNINRAYSNLPVNMWLVTKTQSPDKFYIIITNSYNINPTRDSQLIILELSTDINDLSSEYIYERIGEHSKLNIETINKVVRFVMTNFNTFLDYYLEINNRTETLFKIITV